MARALRAWAINRGGKNSVRNLRYGPRIRLVSGIYLLNFKNLIQACVQSGWPSGLRRQTQGECPLPSKW